MNIHRRFMELAISEAQKSLSEDARIHPKVGVVVVKSGAVLATGFRGEGHPGVHAEFVALDTKLREVVLAGTTVYTTLEPCTDRNHPKVPCARRLAERRVRRVLIGMVDPDPKIRGTGILALRDAGIAVSMFPKDLAEQVESMNYEFLRQFTHSKKATWVDTAFRFLGWFS